MSKKILMVLGIVTLLFTNVSAQTNAKKKERKGEFYFSWGYNKEWYTQTELHVQQASLGNDYTMKGVRSYDHPGWNEALLHMAISIPQYNYRIGYLYNKEKGLGFEINFDHTKYMMAEQDVHIVGKMNNRTVDTVRSFRNSDSSYYFLNNGANFLLFNVVKRWHLTKSRNEKVKLDFLGKVGIGPVIPHVQNSIFGKANDQGFQFGGWNVGLEGALKATFYDVVYLEFANKIDYARYSGLKIYEGTAHQAFGTYELILNLGVNIPMGKRLK